MALNDKTRKHNDMDFQKDLSEILTNAKIGLWAIEMDEGKEPRMYFDDVAREITGFYEDIASATATLPQGFRFTIVSTSVDYTVRLCPSLQFFIFRRQKAPFSRYLPQRFYPV